MKSIFNIGMCLFLLLPAVFLAQSNDVLKREAQKQMQAGRYGEAIDMLNKYIAANPRLAEGLNLRGLCYEKRGQYEEAVLDLRRAIRLLPGNREIQTNLSRVENTWYPLLNKKIEGHKREIAINPAKGVNYLEIGKCMKDLGKWDDAETWYDEFLKREDASPDEVIRYSEILAHNNHLVKGEKILKIYTDRFPGDQRLWSRYGFFTMWLGKIKIAIKAFENALVIKPYFKEAQDGLDQAKGKAYIFEWTDTTQRYKKAPVAQEFAIDKYYKILRKKPGEDATRFQLVNELIKYDRLEEAHQQLQLLAQTHSEEAKFQQLYDSVNSYRNKLYKEKIAEYTARYEKDSTDKQAVLKLAEFYSNLNDYDNASTILNRYLTGLGGDAPDVRFLYAKIKAWNREFEKSIEQLNILLAKEPDNLDYQMLRGQISVWTDQDFDQAAVYLKNVITKYPDKLEAIVALGSLYIKKQDMVTAAQYIDIAKKIDANHDAVKELQSYYDFQVLRLEEIKTFQILQDGRQLAMDGNCEASIPKYEEYLSKVPTPDRLVLIEYADVNSCAKNFSKAIEIYDKVLQENYDYDVALLRAKSYLWGGDSLNALSEFKKLSAERPDNYDAKLLLGDAYFRMKEYSESSDIYESLLDASYDDSVKVLNLKQRLSWMPVSGISGFFQTFPNYIGFNPQFAYYTDNTNLQFKNTGGRVELGVTNFLTLGVSFSRGSLESQYTYRNFSVFKGHVFIRPTSMILGSFGFGNLTYQGADNRKVMDASLKVEKENLYLVTANFERTDAGLILYSPRMVSIYVNNKFFRISADRYLLTAKYDKKNFLHVSGLFSYLKMSDGNAGNDFQIRAGRRFDPDFGLGYEYYYSNYARKSNYYYSPRNFESHSIWGDWDLENTKDLVLTLGGKVGYVPMSDFILREINASASYKIISSLTISAKLNAGGTYREDVDFNSNYNYLSLFFSAYWSF